MMLTYYDDDDEDDDGDEYPEIFRCGGWLSCRGRRWPRFPRPRLPFAEQQAILVGSEWDQNGLPRLKMVG